MFDINPEDWLSSKYFSGYVTALCDPSVVVFFENLPEFETPKTGIIFHLLRLPFSNFIESIASFFFTNSFLFFLAQMRLC